MYEALPFHIGLSTINAAVLNLWGPFIRFRNTATQNAMSGRVFCFIRLIHRSFDGSFRFFLIRKQFFLHVRISSVKFLGFPTCPLRKTLKAKLIRVLSPSFTSTPCIKEDGKRTRSPLWTVYHQLRALKTLNFFMFSWSGQGPPLPVAVPNL